MSMVRRGGLGRRLLPMLLTLGLAAGLVAVEPGQAKAESYKYTDKNGVVHFTDDPYDLPEPQRSKVLRRLERERLEQEKRREQGLEEIPPEMNEKLPRAPIVANPAAGNSGTSSGSPPASPLVDPTNSGQRKLWQEKAATARKRVAELEERCATLRAARDDSNRKSLIFATPGARANFQKSTEELEKCDAELAKAKQHRDEELPEQARRAGVPPGWLRQ